MRIGDRRIGPGLAPYVIAEIGVNHDGSPERARELAIAARDAGADAVKFQSFSADSLLSSDSPLAEYQFARGADDARALLAALELDRDALAGLVDHVHGLGLHAIVTEFCIEDVAMTAALPWDALKVASPDLVNRPLVEAIARTGLPLVVSTGAAELDEVRRTAGWLADHATIFLHCVSAYPTPDDDATLASMATIADVTGRPVGYSDHTTATDTGGLAVAAGACALEKHITWNREAPGPDHAASLDPGGFREYVALARRAWRMRGDGQKRVQTVEREMRSVARESLTTTRALSPGEVIGAADLTVKRPGTGLEPWRLSETIGRAVARPVAANQPLMPEDLA